MSEHEMEWNATNERLQDALAKDPAWQAMAVETEPSLLLWIVVEPGRVLNASSVAEIAIAQRVLPVGVVQGLTPKAELESVRRAIDAAAARVRPSPTTKGLHIATDWLHGRVRLTGDVAHGQAIVNEAAIDSPLVIVEDGPGGTRLQIITRSDLASRRGRLLVASLARILQVDAEKVRESEPKRDRRAKP